MMLSMGHVRTERIPQAGVYIMELELYDDVNKLELILQAGVDTMELEPLPNESKLVL